MQPRPQQYTEAQSPQSDTEPFQETLWTPSLCASVFHCERKLHQVSRGPGTVQTQIERGFTPDEAVALATSVGWSYTPRGVATVLELEPEGAFAVRDGTGALVGMVTCVVWDTLAWIGTMVVDARARRQGTGRALLRRAIAHAHERGARTLALDATPAGRPLYESEGFSATWGESARWQREGDIRAPEVASGDFAIYPVSPAEIMELVRYDTPRFGGGRGRYLGALMAQRPHQSFVAVHRATGAFSGLALSHDGRIGPLVADTPEAAAWLLHAIERAGATGAAIVPAWNPRAEALFASAGYTKIRSCARMFRGPPLPGRRDTTYGIGAWALG